MMDGRRKVTISSIEEVLPEVDRLLVGYRKVGNWSLGQICNHLAINIRGSIEGFPVNAPWLVRKLIGPIVKREILRTGTVKAGMKTPQAFIPISGLDDRAEAEALRATIRLFSGEVGPLATHPFFGPLSLAEWHRLHCIHSAHHLSFVVPGASEVG
jgi:Protein of unknown function (DUF1569)